MISLIVVNVRRVAIVFVCFLSAGVSPARSFEQLLSATVTGQWAENIDSSQMQSLRMDVTPEWKLHFDNGVRLTAIGRLRTEDVDESGPNFLLEDGFGAASRPQVVGNSTDISLREFYLETEWKDYYITAGKQQVVWGNADGLKVLDIVNPESFQYFILEDFEDSRIPTWMLNIERPVGDWDAQFLWIPDQTYSAIPESGASFEITSPLFLPQVFSAVQASFEDAHPVVAEWLETHPVIRDRFFNLAGKNVVVRDTDKPGRVVKDSDAGFRLLGLWQGWDLSVNYLYHYHDLTVFKRTIDTSTFVPTVTIEPEYKRTHSVGGSASNAFGDWVLRSEFGYSTDRYFHSDNSLDQDGLEKGHEFSYVIGLDWSGLENTLISAQLFQSYISAKDTVRDSRDSNVTFLYRRQFWNETLTADMIWLGNLNAEDGLFRPKLSYQWSDDLTIWLGADIFYGDEEGPFGQFDDNDQAVLGFTVDY